MVCEMATKVWLRSRSTKLQAPAYAEAASRRQAKQQINSNDQNPNFQTKAFSFFGIKFLH